MQQRQHLITVKIHSCDNRDTVYKLIINATHIRYELCIRFWINECWHVDFKYQIPVLLYSLKRDTTLWFLLYSLKRDTPLWFCYIHWNGHNTVVFVIFIETGHNTVVCLSSSPPKWPSTSLFDDILIWQTRDRDSKQNIKIPNRSSILAVYIYTYINNTQEKSKTGPWKVKVLRHTL